MSVTLRAPVALLLLAGTLSGCSRLSGLPTHPLSDGGSTDDQAQIVNEMAQDPAILEDGVSDSQDPVALGGGSGLTAIQPLNYWRVIRERTRRFEFAFSDTDTTGRPTRAVVTVTTRLRGTFDIAVGVPGSDDTPLDSTRDVIRKPLDELRVRRVLLRRVREATSDVAGALVDDRPRWRVAAVSGVQVSSRDHSTQIVSLRVRQDGGADTTFTDVLAFMRLPRLLRLEPGADVLITVTTGRADDVVALLHADRRFRLYNNGDNTYSGVFPSGLFVRGMHHLGVDAIAHGTLFDDQAPYDSQRWALPYVLAPELLEAPPL